MNPTDKTISPAIGRRQFLLRTSTAAVGVCFVPLACESNLVEPITFGRSLPFITPTSDFFVKVGAEIAIPNWQEPAISEAAWSLSIDGTGTTPRTVTFADLEAEAGAGHAISILKTMRCVIDSNEVGGLIGTAVWTGIPLTRFIDPASVDAAVRRVRVFASDGFTNNFPIDRLTGNAGSGLVPPLLVTHMNGEPLTRTHGGPVRLLLNETFGFKNVKWISQLELTDSDLPFGTYQNAGFADDGVIRVVSRSTNPIQNAVVPTGRIRISGFAVSGAAPINAVHVAVDGSGFVEATHRTLEDIVATDPLVESALQVMSGDGYPFRAVWTQWYYDTELTPGGHQIRVRARDGEGNEQPETDTEISDGINAIASISVEAV